MAGQPCKSDISNSNFNVDSKIENQICPAGIEIDLAISNSNLPCKNQNSNLVLPNGIDLANEVLDLRDLTERYWRIIQTQHVRIALLENDLRCVKTAKP